MGLFYPVEFFFLPPFACLQHRPSRPVQPASSHLQHPVKNSVTQMRRKGGGEGVKGSGRRTHPSFASVEVRSRGGKKSGSCSKLSIQIDTSGLPDAFSFPRHSFLQRLANTITSEGEERSPSHANRSELRPGCQCKKEELDIAIKFASS